MDSSVLRRPLSGNNWKGMEGGSGGPSQHPSFCLECPVPMCVLTVCMWYEKRRPRPFSSSHWGPLDPLPYKIVHALKERRRERTHVFSCVCVRPRKWWRLMMMAERARSSRPRAKSQSDDKTNKKQQSASSLFSFSSETFQILLSCLNEEPNLVYKSLCNVNVKLWLLYCFYE